MATPDEMILAGTLAPKGADALETYAFFDSLGGRTASAEEWRRKAALQEEFGTAEVDMGKLLKSQPAPGPTTGPTELEIRNAIRVVVNDGGEWDSGSRVWPKVMGRANGMRLGYLPMFNAYNLFKSPARSTPDVGWDAWVARMKQYAGEMRSGAHEWIIGIPLWPHKGGSWAEAARGGYREQWRRFWLEWKVLGTSARRHWLRPWEFTGDHYGFTVTEGNPYDGNARLDLAKCRNMSTAVRIFLEIGREVLGANVPRYDHNIAGGPADAQLEGIRLAAPPKELVGSMTMDRYVQRGDSDDPARWDRDLRVLRQLAKELDAPWGISEGSFFFDKTSGGKQLGAPDSAGSVECLRITDRHMVESIKATDEDVCRIILFNRCPNPEGHMAMMTQGARGTCTHPDNAPHNRPIPVHKVDGFDTHCPRLFTETRKLWGGGLKAA